jgi:hypothetical protein
MFFADTMMPSSADLLMPRGHITPMPPPFMVLVFFIFAGFSLRHSLRHCLMAALRRQPFQHYSHVS